MFDIKHLPGFRVPPIPRHGGGRGGCRGHLLPQNGEFRYYIVDDDVDVDDEDTSFLRTVGGDHVVVVYDESDEG